MPPYGAAEAAALNASLARLRSTVDGLRSFHAERGRVSSKHKKLSEALILATEGKDRRHIEQLLSSIKPHLEQTEQRLASKITQATAARFGLEPEPEPEPETWSMQDGPTTPKLLQGLKVSGAHINPLAGEWVSRTVYIGGIATHEADPNYIKACVNKVGARQAEAVKHGGVHTPGVVVSINVRAKVSAEPESWALVSFSRAEAAERLLEEQEKDFAERCTGTEWHFLKVNPEHLHSYEARRAAFSAKQDAVEWEEGGMVQYAAKRFKENHAATNSDRTVWIGNIPDRIAANRFEEQLHELFGQFGAIAQVQTRYKQPPFADGRSWALVTFKDIAAVRRAMKQKVIIPEFTEATGMPVGQEDRMTELVINHMDKQLVTKSPLGHQAKLNHIKALELARQRYLGYSLAEHHPTLVRLQHQLGHLKRQVGDEDGAKFAEQETLRLAKAWLEEQLSLSGDGSLAECNVYKEDAQFMKCLLKGQTVANKSPQAVQAGRLQVDAHEALATPRPTRLGADLPALRDSLPKRRIVVPPVIERPTRPWADG